MIKEIIRVFSEASNLVTISERVPSLLSDVGIMIWNLYIRFYLAMCSTSKYLGEAAGSQETYQKTVLSVQ